MVVKDGIENHFFTSSHKRNLFRFRIGYSIEVAAPSVESVQYAHETVYKLVSRIGYLR